MYSFIQELKYKKNISQIYGTILLILYWTLCWSSTANVFTKLERNIYEKEINKLKLFCEYRSMAFRKTFRSFSLKFNVIFSRREQYVYHVTVCLIVWHKTLKLAAIDVSWQTHSYQLIVIHLVFRSSIRVHRVKYQTISKASTSKIELADAFSCAIDVNAIHTICIFIDDFIDRLFRYAFYWSVLYAWCFVHLTWQSDLG